MYYFIINPKAQSGKAMDIWREIKHICHEQDIEYRFVFSKYPGQMTDIMKRHTASEDPKHIFVLGGDGSFNEIVNGLSNPAIHKLTFLPAGSGNDLSRGLGLPKDPVELFKQVIEKDEEESTHIDLGCVTYTGKEKKTTNRLFAVSSGFGFDAAITKRVNKSNLKKVMNKIGLGKLSYVISGVIQLFTWKPQDALLWVDDAEEPMHLKRFLFMATHVHPYEGGGFPFCPDAQNGDGYIDLCVVSGLHLIQLFPLIPLAKIGKHVGKKGVQIIRCKKAHIQVENPVAFHTDGESHVDQTEVTVASNEYGYNLIS